MASIHTVLIKKANSNDVYSSLDDFNIACLNFPFKMFGETKEFYSVDWKDENGVDTYFPAAALIEPYEMEVEFGYIGQAVSSGTPNLHLAASAAFSFYKFLTGNDELGGSGTELTIYSPFTNIGRGGIYAKKMSDELPRFMLKQERGNLYNENVLTFKVTFKVCNPLTQIVLNE